MKYIFSVHAHRYHANLGKRGCLEAKWSGKVIRSRPTHYSLSAKILHRAPPPRLQVDQNFLT